MSTEGSDVPDIEPGMTIELPRVIGLLAADGPADEIGKGSVEIEVTEQNISFIESYLENDG